MQLWQPVQASMRTASSLATGARSMYGTHLKKGVICVLMHTCERTVHCYCASRVRAHAYVQVDRGGAEAVAHGIVEQQLAQRALAYVRRPDNLQRKRRD